MTPQKAERKKAGLVPPAKKVGKETNDRILEEDPADGIPIIGNFL